MSIIIQADAGIGLQGVQGNILKGHGRKYTMLVLFCFGDDTRRNRQLLRDAADPTNVHHVTTAAEQKQQASELKACYEEERKSSREPSAVDKRKKQEQQPFRSLGLTAAGLTACGHASGSIGPKNDTWTDFWNGMKPEDLHDDIRWQDEYRNPLHGVWLLANADCEGLGRMETECRNWLQNNYGAMVKHTERGFRWEPFCDSIGYEPFGFADGFMRIEVREPRPRNLAGQLLRGIDRLARWFKHYDEMPLEQVMVVDPPEVAGSSLLVFRKLEQNVQEFVRAERNLADQIKALPPGQRPRVRDAAALFIGRERDGTPLVEGGRPKQTNFVFQGDPEARRCPFHAHVRKVNPRQDFEGLGNKLVDDPKDQRKAQFFRRGMVYGPPEKLQPFWSRVEDAPTTEVGLLFMGYMTDINRQFVEIHSRWAGSDKVPTEGDELDPLTRQNPARDWEWPARAELRLKVQFNDSLVTAKGGAYFLVPSIRCLLVLGQSMPPGNPPATGLVS